MPYEKFKQLWEAAGRRNALMRAYTEDHGPGWFITQEESDAIGLKLHAMRICEAERKAFVTEWAPYFEVWAVYADGVPRLQAAPDFRRWQKSHRD